MTEPSERAKPKWTAWAKVVVQLFVAALVIWGIGRAIRGAGDGFRDAGFGILQLDPVWLAIAALSYAAGMLPPCFFWRRILLAMGQHPDWRATIVAFYTGHLGKYVPGKALVVVLRTGLIKGPRVDTTVAATSVFVETLTMMAVGAGVSAVLLAAWLRHQGWQFQLAVFLALAAGIPTWPPLFQRVVKWLRLRRANPDIEQAVGGIDLRLMSSGWLMMAVTWGCWGVALWAILNAMPGTVSPLADLPLLTACVALAVVAGFLSLIPAGAGMRELVVISLLLQSPHYNEVTAIVSAAILRLLSIGIELLFVAGVSLLRRGAVAQVSSRPQDILL